MDMVVTRPNPHVGKDLVHFEWKVSDEGYSIDYEALTVDWVSVELGRRTYPLDAEGALFRIFGYTEISPAGILGFANTWGHLGFESNLPNSTVSTAVFVEPLSKWRDEILTMRAALDLWDVIAARDVETATSRVEFLEGGQVQVNVGGPFQPCIISGLKRSEVLTAAAVALCVCIDKKMGGSISVTMAHQEHHPRLLLSPVNLLSALWLQFANAISAEKDFHACRRCGKWFEVGPGAAKSHAVFCSNACRQSDYRARHSKAVELARDGTASNEIAKELDTPLETVERWIRKE